MTNKKLLRAKQVVADYFSFQNQKVYKYKDLTNILSAQKELWGLGDRITHTEYFDFIKGHIGFQEVLLNFPSRKERRYTHNDVSVLDIAISLKAHSYFTHHTAATLHGLVKPSTDIYINVEQPPKRFGQGSLSQERIDLAFRNHVRVSNNKAQYNEKTIWILNGMHTGRLGVVSLAIGTGEVRPVTNIERTLIDMSVRPAYSGGVAEVLQAYKSGAGKASVPEIVDTLRKIAYVYPYHQVIGFYLDKSGAYNPEEVELLRKMDMNYDFYLTHGMEKMEYSPGWRLFYPSDL